MNLQFFADGDASGAENASVNGAGAQTTGAESGSASGVETNATGTQNQSNATEKTFTQAELSATAAREKAQGRASVFKMFGVADEKEAKAQTEIFKKWQDEQKTADQKKADAEKKCIGCRK